MKRKTARQKRELSRARVRQLGDLLDTREASEHLGVSQAWVRSHADALEGSKDARGRWGFRRGRLAFLGAKAQA